MNTDTRSDKENRRGIQEVRKYGMPGHIAKVHKVGQPSGKVMWQSDCECGFKCVNPMRAKTVWALSQHLDKVRTETTGLPKSGTKRSVGTFDSDNV